MPRGGTWGKPYPTFGNTAFTNTVVVPADIAALVISLGVTPLAMYDARYGLTSTNWPDARGTGPVASFTVGGAPTISGSGATAQAAFTASQQCIATYSGAIPATGVSMLYVGTNSTANAFGPFVACASPTASTWGIGTNGSFWSALQFVTTTKHVASAQTASTTVNAMAVSAAWSGDATVEVDAQAQFATAGAFTAVTPDSGVLTLGIAGEQSVQKVQALIFLPNLYTAGQFSTFVTWATANHTFTAQ